MPDSCFRRNEKKMNHQKKNVAKTKPPHIYHRFCFPGGSVVKNLPAMQETFPVLGGSPGGGHGKYSCLENPMDRGAWWATVHRATKSQTKLNIHT